MKSICILMLLLIAAASMAAPAAWSAEGCCPLPRFSPAHQRQTPDALSPYPLDTCIVSGAKLGSMGDPVVLVHEGQEVKFCCAGCVPAFKADPEKYLQAIR